MDKQKLILVACGTGIATSTVVCKKVEDLIKANGINARVIQCKISEVPGYEDAGRSSSNNYNFITNTINFL